MSLTQSSVELSVSASDELSGTIPKIENTTKLVQEISASSTEQTNGTNHVNNAMQQLNNLTQQNASASEELASSAEEMSGQAKQLKELISYFHVKA